MSTVKTDNVVGSFTPLPVVNSANAVETYLASAGQTVFTTTKFDQTSAIKVFAKVGSNFVEVVATWASLNTVTISGITLTAGQKVYVYSVGDVTLKQYASKQEYYRTIESFGKTDTPANTKATMQTAINFCAANGVIMRGKSQLYIIDVSVSSITIPSNFKCNLEGAKIQRATGNATPHDMWVNLDTVNGNSGLDIRGVYFDGKAQVDSLTNATVAHRFCGLRLIKCQGKLVDVRADATVNGEIQVEGTRGGILLEQSVFMDCSNIRTDNTIGTGLFITGGSGRLYNFQSNNNTGSGLSGDQPGWMMNNLSSKVSGYSGISINGPGFIVRGVYASGAASGFAGVNFGHATPASSNGVDGVASDIVAENNASWGINATSCPGIQGENWVSKNSGDNNIRLINSPGARLSVQSKGSLSNGLLIDGAGHYAIEARISGCSASGVYGRNGADIVLSSGSLITGNGSIGGFTAGVTVDTNSKAKVQGKVIDNLSYGVQSVDSSVLTVSGSIVKGNTSGNTRAANSGVIRYENAKFSDDAMSGIVTITAGTAITTVTNGNAMDPTRITFSPGNAAARTAGQALVSSLTVGTNFAVQIAANAATDAIYRWAIV